MTTTSRTLYRPVGFRELELILDADARAFPPRLPEQPIFYPVLNSEYAEQIARNWNTPDEASGYAGFVTAFDVDAEYLKRFDVKVVGALRHQELWVPAEELSEFNAHIQGRIRVTHAFYGSRYQGPRVLTPEPGEDPRHQLQALSHLLAVSPVDLDKVIDAHWQCVFINHGFWSVAPAREQGLSESAREQVLQSIAAAWEKVRPDLPLPPGYRMGEV
ncbi:hypothetical protein OV208_34050 [Corallococcus sp. bb12-1]|uniref:hypothetical protein n=1 Tax=Corallococcus sp. bb12-1 TaxID=2996784 RepID=UPI00226F0DA7|nr:hypothetical protein [Corallococcus sp. bb12-1]MCY1046378.1 hypothetical protein [Corallococcus sp. bb12-1]